MNTELILKNSEDENLYTSLYTYGPNTPQREIVHDTLATNMGSWMTLEQISKLTGIESQSSIASRIRDIRTQGFNIERRSHPNAGGKTRIFEYRYF